MTTSNGIGLKTTKGKLADLMCGSSIMTPSGWAEFDELVDAIRQEAIDGFYSETLAAAKERADRADAATAHEREHRAKAEKLVETLYENLTATQTRCTELLNANRLGKHLEQKPGDASAFLALAWDLEAARVKHPKGPDGTRSLGEEFGEVCNAIRRKTLKDVRDELLNLATVALRLYMGEHLPGALSPVSSGAETIAPPDVGELDDEHDSHGERTSRSAR